LRRIDQIAQALRRIDRRTGCSHLIRQVAIRGCDEWPDLLLRARSRPEPLEPKSGTQLLAATTLPVESRSRIDSLLRVITALDFEIDTFARAGHPGGCAPIPATSIQAIPGVGPLLGAVFVAEIGDIARFTRPQQLACWAGLTGACFRDDNRLSVQSLVEELEVPDSIRQASGYCTAFRSCAVRSGRRRLKVTGCRHTP
jgi:transposase